MHKYQVTLLMADGSRGTAWGLFDSDWDAIDQYLGAFPTLTRISLRRLS